MERTGLFQSRNTMCVVAGAASAKMLISVREARYEDRCALTSHAIDVPWLLCAGLNMAIAAPPHVNLLSTVPSDDLAGMLDVSFLAFRRCILCSSTSSPAVGLKLLEPPSLPVCFSSTMSCVCAHVIASAGHARSNTSGPADAVEAVEPVHEASASAIMMIPQPPPLSEALLPMAIVTPAVRACSLHCVSITQ